MSRPTRPLQGLGQSEESQQVPGDLASEAAEAVALEDRSGRLGGLEPLGGRAICALPLGDGVDYPIFDWKAAEWARQFPGADVPVQLAKMRAWLLSSIAYRFFCKTPCCPKLLAVAIALLEG